MSRSLPASGSSASLHGTPCGDHRASGGQGRHAASGAAGDGGPAWQPMRLLHARLRDERFMGCGCAIPIRARGPSKRRCRAISAAAPAMRRSSAPARRYRPMARRRPIRCGPSAIALKARIEALNDGARVEIGEGRSRVIVPASLDDLAEIYEANPGATLVAGSTDVGLWVTKFMRDIGPMIFIGHLPELQAHRRERRRGAVLCRGHLFRGAAGADRRIFRNWPNSGTGSRASRCAIWARSAAISPMARPSGTRRRR